MKKGDEWGTQRDLLDKLNEEFHFEIDLAASKANYKPCGLYITKKQNSLTFDWTRWRSCWLNPPYSKPLINQFMKKCSDSVELWADNVDGGPWKLVALVRFDPTTTWFKQHVDGVAAEVRMLARRVKFEGASSAYAFPCCVVVYSNDNTNWNWDTEYYIWDWKE